MPRRRKPGRPRELVRPRILHMRLGIEHWRLIESWAERHRMTDSDAVRQMLSVAALTEQHLGKI